MTGNEYEILKNKAFEAGWDGDFWDGHDAFDAGFKAALELAAGPMRGDVLLGLELDRIFKELGI